MTYRRRRDSETWHWRRNCSAWPTGDYEERLTRLSAGELCNECMTKELEQQLPEQIDETGSPDDSGAEGRTSEPDARPPRRTSPPIRFSL